MHKNAIPLQPPLNKTISQEKIISQGVSSGPRPSALKKSPTDLNDKGKKLKLLDDDDNPLSNTATSTRYQMAYQINTAAKRYWPLSI